MSSGLSIIWAPALPWPVIAALAVAAAVVVALALLRGAKGSLLRAAFLTVLLLALANPSLVNEVRQPLEDIALAVTALFQDVVATDFPTRAGAIADQVALHNPQVIGLNEVSTFDFASTPGIELDYLAILMDRERRSRLSGLLKQLRVMENYVRANKLFHHSQEPVVQKGVEPCPRVFLHVVGVQDPVA